jgi:D-alanyl-lipoteichoic acid acyltransferase DltB (MBOAT superfamily)
LLLVGYYTVNKKYQKYLLLFASVIFLGYLSINFLVFTLGFILVNYLIGIGIGQAKNPDQKQAFYLIGVLLDISLLAFFKYINFLLENILSIFGPLFHPVDIPYFDVLAPIGISFYTFQCIGYFIDLKRGTYEPEKNLLIFTNFVLFFPKLLSGPIERSNHLFPQLKKTYQWNPKLFNDGLVQMFWGLFKKLVIADRFALMVSNVYGDLYDYSGMPLLIILVVQVFHLYFDFSGYTDIVLGTAKLFGIRLINNFERPLLAKNVSMFWRRWHISLTQWCNDYIFRRIIIKRLKWKQWASVYGVFITFLVIGIWHGPRWNYVLLGILQAVAINYEFFTKRKRLKVASRVHPKINVFLSRCITFVFFGVTLIFFNASTVQETFYFIGQLFTGFKFQLTGYNLGLPHEDILIAVIGTIIVLLVDYLNEKNIFVRDWLGTKPVWLRWAFYYGLVLAVILFGKFAASGFIYVQF